MKGQKLSSIDTRVHFNRVAYTAIIQKRGRFFVAPRNTADDRRLQTLEFNSREIRRGVSWILSAKAADIDPRRSKIGTISWTRKLEDESPFQFAGNEWRLPRGAMLRRNALLSKG